MPAICKARPWFAAVPNSTTRPRASAKLTAILQENDIQEITIVNMEVPCCFGLVQVVRQAMEASGKTPPVTICTLGTAGQVLQQQKVKGK